MCKSSSFSSLPGLALFYAGKVRYTFKTIDKSMLLVVATDKLSTHNVVHFSQIPHKGEVLTALTVFWLAEVLSNAGISHHMVACGRDIYQYLRYTSSDYPAGLHRRAIVIKRREVIPIEFVYRGRLAGSLYNDWYERGKANPYKIILPPGLPLMTQFEPPLFTPTEKSATDDPISAEMVMQDYPEAYQLGLAIYQLGREHLRRCGIELVDTKLEMALVRGKAEVVDEVLTPDSSRFCEISGIVHGKEPVWMDKQLARNEAERLWKGGPKLPLDFSGGVVSNVSATYLNIFKRITGRSLRDFQREYFD